MGRGAEIKFIEDTLKYYTDIPYIEGCSKAQIYGDALSILNALLYVMEN